LTNKYGYLSLSFFVLIAVVITYFLVSNKFKQILFFKGNEPSVNNRYKNEEIEKFRRENADLTLKCALVELKLENALEKCKSLNTMADKNEESLHSTTNDLNRAKEKVHSLETSLQSMHGQLDMYKNNLDHLQKVEPFK
jgi:chromosome segregation ATPase